MMVLRRFALAGAGMCFAAAPALAADLPQETYSAPPVQTAPAQIYNWTGIYLGLHGGWLGGDVNPDFNGAGGADGSAFTGGFHAGANYMVSPQFLVGIEGDVDGTSFDEDGQFQPGVSGNANINWTSSIRGRAGFAFDRFLAYGTGGVAFADVDVSSGGEKESNTHTGWTVGAGLEGMITPNITARVEYLYADYGSQDYTFAGNTTDVDVTSNVVRAGVSYKF